MTDRSILDLWPGNALWSSQVVRLAALSYSRGADLSEVVSAVAGIRSGDSDGWYKAFDDLANRTRDQSEALGADHRLSRRDLLWRASMYYRNAGVFLAPSDPRAMEAAESRRQTFGAAAEAHPEPIEQIEVPFGDTSLPGWFCTGTTSDAGPRPIVIVVGGTDGVAEEMYFALGGALVARGYSVLVFDGPGQGEALRRGVLARADFEVAISAAIDFVSERPDVNADRVGLVGHSLGGLYAARAAASDSRLRGTVIASAPFDLLANLTGGDSSDTDETAMGFFVALYSELTGSQSLDEALRKLADFHLRDAVKNIHTPLLALYGADDALVAVADGERILAEAPTTDKTLIVYPSGSPGSSHCQQDSLPVAQLDLCNWIESHI
ncbi:alpha-beta hydrolase superfamily lysophospholipase [Rhodococcus sp. OAS809]|uniref:alpha/beta hydrolase family protein n=1 Tax=Rhodococcus sp. OAS809 TaxID=2663874 RepID=UPI00178BE0C4